jgi:hypothetical protein
MNGTGRRTDGQAQSGDIVTYEDVANPRRAFMVTRKVEDRWGVQYRLMNLDDETFETSDLRQHGWMTWMNVYEASAL